MSRSLRSRTGSLAICRTESSDQRGGEWAQNRKSAKNKILDRRSKSEVPIWSRKFRYTGSSGWSRKFRLIQNTRQRAQIGSSGRCRKFRCTGSSGRNRKFRLIQNAIQKVQNGSSGGKPEVPVCLKNLQKLSKSSCPKEEDDD